MTSHVKIRETRVLCVYKGQVNDWSKQTSSPLSKMNVLGLLCVCGLVILPTPVQAKTWVFAVGGNRRPWNFIGDDGVLKGADLDLIQAVCEVANQKCATTVVPTEACVQTVRGRFYPGEGLMAGWFDACTSYVSSIDRVNALQFTDPIRTTTSTFTVLKGNPKNFDPQNIQKAVIGNPKNFDPQNLQNAVIVHLNGAFTNEQCTIRIGLGKPKTVLVASGIAEAKELLLNQTADALFSPRTTFNDLEVLPGRYRCDVSGVGMMVKKDSELPVWWNPAFQKYYLSGRYNDACDQINQKYGGFPVHNCLPRPTTQQGIVGTGSAPIRKRQSRFVVQFTQN